MTPSVAPRVRRIQEVLVDPQETDTLVRLGLDLLDIASDGLRADPATPR